MATTKDRMDPLWRQAADLVVKQGVGSTSLVQRGLRVGHTRASAINVTRWERVGGSYGLTISW